MTRLETQSASLLQLVNSIMEWLKAHRTIVLVPFSILFFVGLIWSFDRLDTDLAGLSLLPALALFLIMTPLGLVYGATGLMLLARIVGTSIGFKSAWSNAGYAQLAEALPLPGGAIVRTAALMQSGSTTGKSVFIVTATAILWVAMAAIGASTALFADTKWAAFCFLCVGLAAFIPILIWLVRNAGVAVAVTLVAHRLVGLALMSVRLILAFAVIGHFISAEQALLFSFANISGSASSIAPAGLGVGEAVGALLAGLIRIDPAAAFLAIGLNRIIGLSSCLLIVAIGHFSEKSANSPTSKRVLK
jgi:hypothetical protein